MNPANKVPFLKIGHESPNEDDVGRIDIQQDDDRLSDSDNSLESSSLDVDLLDLKDSSSEEEEEPTTSSLEENKVVLPVLKLQLNNSEEGDEGAKPKFRIPLGKNTVTFREPEEHEECSEQEEAIDVREKFTEREATIMNTYCGQKSNRREKEEELRCTNESDDVSCGPTTARTQEKGRDERRERVDVSVDLLTPAFSLRCDRESGRVHGVRSQCAERFGVRMDRVKVYGMMKENGTPPVEQWEHEKTRMRCCVEIVGSDFTLEALEEILHKQQEYEKNTKKQQIKHLGTENKTKNANEATAIQRMEARVKELEDKLAASEHLRIKAQKALKDLRHEFELLYNDIKQQYDL